MLARHYIGESWKHGLLIIGALIVLIPFYMMVSMSLKSQQEIQSISGGLVGAQEIQTFPVCTKHGYTEEVCTMRPYKYNFWFAFKKAPIPRYLMNGLIVTVSIFLIQVLIALPCSYALAKLRFKGREFVFSMVLFCLLIPVHAIALPLYVMLAKAGLVDTYAALIIPWTISVFGIFLMRQFFMTVPDELIDAARMDGMGEYSIVWKVMLPEPYQRYSLLQFSQLLLTGMIIFGLGLLSQVIVIYLHHHLVLENLEAELIVMNLDR